MQQQQTQLQENALYIFRKGKLEQLETPPHGFGKQELLWQNSQLQMNTLNYTQRYDGK